MFSSVFNSIILLYFSVLVHWVIKLLTFSAAGPPTTLHKPRSGFHHGQPSERLRSRTATARQQAMCGDRRAWSDTRGRPRNAAACPRHKPYRGFKKIRMLRNRVCKTSFFPSNLLLTSSTFPTHFLHKSSKHPPNFLQICAKYPSKTPRTQACHLVFFSPCKENTRPHA